MLNKIQETKTERMVTMDCKKYLKEVRERIEQKPIYVEDNPTHQIYLDKIRAIAERYIDENDVEIEADKFFHHPAWFWRCERPRDGSPEMEAILESLRNPEEAEIIQSELKATMKAEMLRYSWWSIIHLALRFPFDFYTVKEAKTFMAANDFSVMMYDLPGCYAGPYHAKDGITKADVFGLIEACNLDMLKLVNSWRDFHCLEEYEKEWEMEVYLADDFIEDDSDFATTFAWMTSPEKVIEYYLDIYGEYDCWGVYVAKIKVKDIFWCFSQNERGYILNPDKVYDIEYIPEVSDLLDEDEIREIKAYCGIDDDQDDDEDGYDDDQDDEDWDD